MEDHADKDRERDHGKSEGAIEADVNYFMCDDEVEADDRAEGDEEEWTSNELHKKELSKNKHRKGTRECQGCMWKENRRLRRMKMNLKRLERVRRVRFRTCGQQRNPLRPNVRDRRFHKQLIVQRRLMSEGDNHMRSRRLEVVQVFRHV